MSVLKLLLFPTKVTLPGVSVGLASALAFNKVGRPLLVSAVRTAFKAHHGTSRIWQEAKADASALRNEVRPPAPGTPSAPGTLATPGTRSGS